MTRLTKLLALGSVVSACAVIASVPLFDGPLYPGGWGSKLGGTYGDGVDGPFDGVADAKDSTFNGFGGFEGHISLATAGPVSNHFEHRIFWEYDLSGVDLQPPLTATLVFTLRGVPINPFPDVDVHVYAYPANLREDFPEDFSATPATLQGIATVRPFETSVFVVDVTDEVAAALNVADQVAFRFQVDPNTPESSSQAFMDAEDDVDATKPFILFNLGDWNGDDEVNLMDFASFPECMDGPDLTVGLSCQIFDFDVDGDVDAEDYATFQLSQSIFAQN